MTAARLHAVSARWGILTASTWTAILQLSRPDSLAARAAGDGLVLDWINVGILALCALGWADLLWHDLRGRLIWPSFPQHARHHVCIGMYALLAAAFGVRAFLAAGSDVASVWLVGGYYICFAVGIMIEVRALREDARGSP